MKNFILTILSVCFLISCSSGGSGPLGDDIINPDTLNLDSIIIDVDSSQNNDSIETENNIYYNCIDSTFIYLNDFENIFTQDQVIGIWRLNYSSETEENFNCDEGYISDLFSDTYGGSTEEDYIYYEFIDYNSGYFYLKNYGTGELFREFFNYEKYGDYLIFSPNEINFYDLSHQNSDTLGIFNYTIYHSLYWSINSITNDNLNINFYSERIDSTKTYLDSITYRYTKFYGENNFVKSENLGIFDDIVW